MTLPLTGERTLPGVASENYWFRRHEAAYAFAAARCARLDVLDAGCGEGYGTAMLARGARRVVGVELAADVVAHATATYPEAAFVRAEVSALPLGPAGFDAAVSLQVIEHLWDIPRFLDEVARVLRPGGVFVCATPNRLTFGPAGQAPVNPFHTVEFDPGELAGLLARWFGAVELHGVFHAERLVAVERARGCRLPDVLLADEPPGWPAWLSRLVASVRAGDFDVRAARHADLASSLDLLAVARGPRP